MGASADDLGLDWRLWSSGFLRLGMCVSRVCLFQEEVEDRISSLQPLPLRLEIRSFNLLGLKQSRPSVVKTLI